MKRARERKIHWLWLLKSHLAILMQFQWQSILINCIYIYHIESIIFELYSQMTIFFRRRFCLLDNAILRRLLLSWAKKKQFDCTHTHAHIVFIVFIVCTIDLKRNKKYNIVILCCFNTRKSIEMSSVIQMRGPNCVSLFFSLLVVAFFL